MARTNRKRKPKTDGRIEPTAEAMAHGDFISAGMAYKRIPVIETMHKRKQITEAEFAALGYYRDQAGLSEKSPVRSCLNREASGGSGRVSVAVKSAILETARIERELGSLRAIARAVAVDDTSLSDWCISQNGGRERYNGNGDFIAVVPIAESRVMKTALLDLKMAARRIYR